MLSLGMVRTLAILLLFAHLLPADPPLLVIALDGFRWDYAERYQATNILSLKRAGASATATMPGFPSTTFPNFHSMATGLFPEHHNLVAMHFLDRASGKPFSYSRNASEGVWYGGTPIWVLAENNGIKTASYFWPGTEAEIQGKRPSYFKKYDVSATHEQRIAQVMEWLRMPEAQRPGLVIVYFSDVDHEGHDHGPNAQQTRDAVMKVDAATGSLVQGARRINPATNIVVVSDHGMSTVTGFIDLNTRANLAGCKAANESPMTMLYCEDSERVRLELIENSPDLNVWRRAETPAHLHYRNNPRIGDLIVTPKTAALVQALPPGDADAKPVRRIAKGMHGYDPAVFPEMRGILIGVGPAFAAQAKVDGVRTVDVFLLLCRLLNLTAPPGIDAELGRVSPMLRR